MESSNNFILLVILGTNNIELMGSSNNFILLVSLGINNIKLIKPSNNFLLLVTSPENPKPTSSDLKRLSIANGGQSVFSSLIRRSLHLLGGEKL